MTGKLIIICGLPGSGKTTLAQQLSTTEQGLRFDPDEWMDVLGINLWDSATRTRVEELQWKVACELLELGGTAILAWGTWGRNERDVLRETARKLGATVELRYLHAPVDILWERIRKRNRENPPMTRSALEEATATFQPPDANEQALFDSPSQPT